MKHGTSAVLIVIALMAASCADAAEPVLETEEQKTLYALGLAISSNLKNIDLTPEEWAIVQAGMTDGVLGNEEKVALETYGPKIEGMMRQRVAAWTEKEKGAGEAFLAEQAAAEGAVKSETGMIYFETAAGTGDAPTASDTVKVHYHGTLRDGNVFDSSREREPVSFPLSGVVPCFSEGIQRMKVGGKSKLICPPELAYGDRGAPPGIPPGATLVFEVELLEIVAPATEPPAIELQQSETPAP
jgi:FKBP-type peptidyl-prolyl cis-trans isomerase FkpA